MATALSKETSDHIPYLISITTDIPKAKVFHFENYWLHRQDIQQVLQHGWELQGAHTDKARRVVAKFRNLRRVLRAWHARISNLAATISNTPTGCH